MRFALVSLALTLAASPAWALSYKWTGDLVGSWQVFGDWFMAMWYIFMDGMFTGL